MKIKCTLALSLPPFHWGGGVALIPPCGVQKQKPSVDDPESVTIASILELPTGLGQKLARACFSCMPERLVDFLPSRNNAKGEEAGMTVGASQRWQPDPEPLADHS